LSVTLANSNLKGFSMSEDRALKTTRARHFTYAVGAIALLIGAAQAPAQSEVPPYGASAAETAPDYTSTTTLTGGTMYSDLGVISGAGNTVNMSRVPVRTSTGSILYKDIVIKFDVGATGTVALSAGFPTVTSSVALSTGNFRAGNYKDTLGHVYGVQGPAALSGGRTKWTLAWVPPAGKTGSFNLTWATGAVTGHPFEGVLKRYGITASTYSWGLVGQEATGTAGWVNPPFGGWATDYAFGAWQTGDQLELHVFGTGSTEYTHVFLTRCATTC
jgi:hypothetical protein